MDWIEDLESDGYRFVPDLQVPTYVNGSCLSTLDYVGLSENLILMDWRVRSQFSAQHLPVLVSILYKGPMNLQGLIPRQPSLRFPNSARRMIQYELRAASLDPEAFRGSVDNLYLKIEKCFLAHGVIWDNQERVSSGPS